MHLDQVVSRWASILKQLLVQLQLAQMLRLQGKELPHYLGILVVLRLLQQADLIRLLWASILKQ